jgi:hypothetical protein
MLLLLFQRISTDINDEELRKERCRVPMTIQGVLKNVNQKKREIKDFSTYSVCTVALLRFLTVTNHATRCQSMESSNYWVIHPAGRTVVQLHGFSPTRRLIDWSLILR